jgi:hypothetical protein
MGVGGFRGETDHNSVHKDNIYLRARHVHAYTPPRILQTYLMVTPEIPWHDGYDEHSWRQAKQNGKQWPASLLSSLPLRLRVTAEL